MTLRFTGSDGVDMGQNTFMWIQVTHFAIGNEPDEHSLLASLVASPAYAYDYATPFDPATVVTEPAVHGRWWRSRIHPELFLPWTASDAAALIQDWADNQDWTDPGFRHPPEVQRSLQDIYALLRSGELYKLDNPGPDDEHEYGHVTGSMGFHEFVVIDRPGRGLHVVVATDD